MKKKSPATPRPGKAAKTAKAAAAQPSVPQARVSFPIVGIGASAGGLEALEQFLGQVPARSGMAFVIIQHLDPTRKGLMPQLLQRATKMEVLQVKDRTRVRPDCVYVIPPNKDLSLLHGILHLLKPVAPRGLRLPIDFFLRSLAQDQHEHSIGVILSGMGSDGTLGLRAIKEQAGVVLVQTPASAKFDGMPRSAIDAGLADIVAPAEELAGKILAYLHRTPLTPKPETPLEDKAHSALEKAVILLRARTGHDFSFYKKNTLYRRIERRMGLHQISKMAGYIRYLQENSQELDLLFKELLIGVTNFFRDPEAWERVRTHAIPHLLADRPPGPALRAWVAGCSTGEEAYSLAMIFKEASAAIKPAANFALQIFATDLDSDAIDKARQGHFSGNITADVSPERLARFFVKEESGYRIRKEIREMVIFAPQNLLMDPPFTKLDFMCCRNVLIYVAPEIQKKLMPLFHHSLNAGGILFLGSSETVGGYTDLFAPLDGKSRLFRRTESGSRVEPVEFPTTFSTPLFGGTTARPVPKPPASLQSLADQLVLQHYAPPAALVNNQGDILYISGHTAPYLEPATGQANWNIFAMVREGLRFELTSAFQKALRQKKSVTFLGRTSGSAGPERFIKITLHQLVDVGPLQGLVMIIFTEMPAPVALRMPSGSAKSAARAGRVAELERELLTARELAHTTREARQSAKEELQSANEELQSANEELQSTNEELTTSKEEMQSLNEELQSVNTELQSKLDELARASDDMKNLLNSTDIATLFLDKDLKVRRFTPQATKIIKLIPSDVGRPITDLASDLSYPELANDGRTVLQTLVAVEKPVGSRDGRCFNMRIMPYRTVDDRIDGVVITFTEITARVAVAKLVDPPARLERRFAQPTAHLGKSRPGAHQPAGHTLKKAAKSSRRGKA